MLRNIFKTSTLNFQLKVLFIFFLFSFSKSWGQTIVSDDFENVSTLFTNTGATYYSGNSLAGAGPGSSPLSQSGTYGIGVTNGTAVLTSSAINTSSCSSVQLNIKLAAFSPTSTTNGMETSDIVKIEVSPDGGTTWWNTLEVDGNLNAFWGFTTGTGIASTAYDGNATPVIFAPGGTSGAKTTDGYSSLTITSLPAVTNMVIKITMLNNSANERWIVDNFVLSGSCTSCTAPTTTITPTTQTVCAGSVSTLTVSSSATTPTYTWEASANGTTGWATVVNSTPSGASYSGINTSTLAITAGSTYYYHCLVTENGTCTATSGTSTLVVNSSPTITTQPVNKTICSGSNASFTVAANGSPLTYQWKENTGAGFATITNGGIYSGATTATLTLTVPPTSMNTYSYQCVVSVASCSSATTTAAVLTVNTTPAAPPAPIPAANPACTTGTLSAASSTVAGVTWYWQGTSSTSSVTTQSTASNYTLSTSGNYYVRALDASGTCWSTTSSVSITVNAPVSAITAQPTNKSVCTGNNTTMDITGGSGSGSTKQWQFSTDNGVTFSNVVADAVNSGVTLASLSLTSPPLSYNGYVYQCVITVPGCAVVTSSTATLTVIQTPSTPPVPVALANPACSSTSLSAMSSTVAGVTWYWQGTTAAGTSTTNPTSSDYGISTSGTYYVRARTDGSSCLSSSSSTVITINTPPSVTTDPTDRTQCVGTNTTFVVAATGTSLTYQWQINTGSGFSNITADATYSNVTAATMSITGITAGMNNYQYRCVINGASPCTAATSNYATLIITASGAPVTAASSPATNAVACNAFNLSWTNGSGSNRLVVISTSAVAGSPVDGTSYTANSTFGSGSTIAAGEYVVYKGSSNSVFINNLSASTAYYYKIFEFNGCSLNYLTSGTIPNGNVTTISCSSPAGITGVYIDACAGSCGFEGNNELIWGTTGSYALKVATNGPTLHYSSSPTPTVTQISTYSINTSNVTALNTALTSTASACTNTVFVDPNTQGYIPANSKFLIANNCMCTPSAYDLSGLCNAGTIYVVFGSGPSWPCNSGGGIFGNANACNASSRYFDLNMSAWGISLDPIYNYDPCLLTSGSDGDIVLFNPAGGSVVTYSNSVCKVPLIVLPIELLDFYATQDGDKNELIWKVASEKNVSQYIIEKSEDGVNFTELTRVNPFNNERGNTNYMCEDVMPYYGITYYRLSTKETDNKINHYKIIDIDRSKKDWKTLVYQQDDNLTLEFKNAVPKNAQLELYDLSGKLLIERSIEQMQTKMNTDKLSAGIYFVKIATPYKTENFKIIISK